METFTRALSKLFLLSNRDIEFLQPKELRLKGVAMGIEGVAVNNYLFFPSNE